MTIEEKLWALDNKRTKISWTEQDVLEEYSKEEADTNWCQAMMIGILGNEAVAMDKYPEMWI